MHCASCAGSPETGLNTPCFSITAKVFPRPEDKKNATKLLIAFFIFVSIPNKSQNESIANVSEVVAISVLHRSFTFKASRLSDERIESHIKLLAVDQNFMRNVEVLNLKLLSIRNVSRDVLVLLGRAVSQFFEVRSLYLSF